MEGADWNRQLDSARRLRISSISFHADALLHPRGAELLHTLAEEQAKEKVLAIWLDEYAQRARAFGVEVERAVVPFGFHAVALRRRDGGLLALPGAARYADFVGDQLERFCA